MLSLSLGLGSRVEGSSSSCNGKNRRSYLLLCAGGGWRAAAPHMCGAALVSQSVLQVLLSFHFWKRPQGQVHGLPGKTGKEWQRCSFSRMGLGWLGSHRRRGKRTTFLTTTLNDGRFCVQSCCLWMRCAAAAMCVAHSNITKSAPREQ